MFSSLDIVEAVRQVGIETTIDLNELKFEVGATNFGKNAFWRSFASLGNAYMLV
jgi:hypothetical protein